MSKVSRREAESHANAGRGVAFVPESGASRRVTDVRRMPAADERGEFVVLYDEGGRLTRAGMELVIREGGSVMHNGKVVTDPAELPAEETLASGNAERLARLRADLDKEIADLQAHKARLGEAAPAPESTPPGGADEDEGGPESHRRGRHRRAE